MPIFVKKKMKKKLAIFTLILSLALEGCNDKHLFNVAVSPSKKMAEYSRLNKIYKKYQEKNGKKFKLKLFDSTIYQLSTNLKLLIDNKKHFDMAIVNNSGLNSKDTNNTDYSKIRIVLPISSRILYIAYNKDKLSPKNINDLFEGSNAVILSYEIDFIKNILTGFGVNISKTNFLKTKFDVEDSDFYKLKKSEKDSLLKIDFMRDYKTHKILPYDIEIGFITHNVFNKSRLFNFLNSHTDFRLFSLDDYQMYRNGSYVEGFCLRNKYFSPYLLPKGTYGEYPETPILTLRQDFNLVASEEVDDEFIYGFVKTAVEETDFIDMSLYGKDFSNINFSFPLHEGTKRYLDKNAPKFFEKYGELLGKIGTGVGGFYTALMGFYLWRKKRKRKIMNDDYQKVLLIQGKIDSTTNLDEMYQIFSTIQTIQKTYHNLVIERKVLIDETFKIFMDTLNKNEKYLLDKITKLQVSGKN